MDDSKFNFHKILFTIDSYDLPQEKLSYLYNLKIEINRIIKCFTKRKIQALKNYAKSNIFAEDGCDELTKFLSEKVKYYGSSKFGERIIDDNLLKTHLNEEVLKYKRLSQLIDSEIEYWIKEKDNFKKKENYKLLRNSENDMESLNKALESKSAEDNIVQNVSTSIRELKDTQQKKIVWKGSKEDLIYFFDHLFNQNLLAIKSYDEVFSILSHYFVDENNEPMRVEKSAAAKLNLTGPKLPKGYQRYINTIERLKDNH